MYLTLLRPTCYSEPVQIITLAQACKFLSDHKMFGTNFPEKNKADILLLVDVFFLTVGEIAKRK